MLGKNKDSTPSLIAESVELVGNINRGNDIEIEGHVEGDIFVDMVTIRESGVVRGNVKCNVFNIKGRFDGNASCEKINISDTATINGVLEYKFLSVDYGANINCELKRVVDDKGSKNGGILGNSKNKESL